MTTETQAQKTLSSEQLWSIANALRSAAQRYSEYSEDAAIDRGIKEQFKRQAAEALGFAELLESADSARIIY